MKNYKHRIGEKYITYQGYEIEIINYENNVNVDIKFSDGTIIRHRQFIDIKKGQVSHPYHKSVLGVGYYGEGRYKAFKQKNYSIWRSMLQRCYDLKYQEKQPTYIGSIVIEEWHNFQNFAKWFEKNYNAEYMQGWQLDKDILCSDCKVYSPDTCVFVPQEINKLFTKRENYRGEYPLGVIKVKHYKKFIAQICTSNGRVRFYKDTPEEAFQAYKEVKELCIKEVAEKWKDKIDLRVYQAMMNYEVNITD